MTQLLTIEQRGPITLVGLNRPEKRNAISDATVAALAEAFADPPEGTRVFILHGAGEHFCAGLDLVEKLSQKRSTFDIVRGSQRWHRAFERIQFGEIPVICVMQGGVIGGGMELAAATHVRIADESTFFQLPEAQRGIFVGGGATVRVERIIGAGRMVEMMLTGRRYEAADGLALGLTHYVVPTGTAMEKALELAEKIASNAPTSNFAIINAIPRIGDMSMTDGLLAESYVVAMAKSSGDGHERIAEFFDGRRALRQSAKS